jgi:type I restriction enzyme M protein
MAETTSDIVAKLWGFCDILRDDGITYQQYVTELTYLLFLKMAAEKKIEGKLPKTAQWSALKETRGEARLDAYKAMLLELSKSKDAMVRAIYQDAQTSMRQPRNLSKLVESIDGLDWFSQDKEHLGDMYEGLLEKNAGEVKSGAGQYFTPRPLVECMVELIKPQAGEVVLDPAAGTAGFLIRADAYVRARTDDLFDLNEQQQSFQRERAYVGVELVPDTARLALMNLMLHGIDGSIAVRDSLSSERVFTREVDVVLSNPPFGTKKGGDSVNASDFTYPTSNKQLLFVQRIVQALRHGGRAAVVVLDNVLFEDGVGAQVRGDLMDKCDLHTILRLPTGIFYAQGVKTNVLFFTRGKKDVGTTKRTWVYDLRTNMPSFGKRTPLTRAHFKEFEEAFGAKSDGTSARQDQGEKGRWRAFSRDDVKARGDNLDLTWLREEGSGHGDELEEPAVIAKAIEEQLGIALSEVRALIGEMG